VTSREGWRKFANHPTPSEREETYVLTSKRVEGEVEYNTGEFAENQTVGMEGIERIFCPRPSKYIAVTPRIRPRSSSIGLRPIGWLESEVEAWIAQRVAVRRDHNSAQNGASWNETTLT